MGTSSQHMGTSPQHMGTSPQHTHGHITSAHGHITSAHGHITSPHEHITSPHEHTTSAHKHITSPQGTSPQHMGTSPHHMNTPPQHMGTSPQHIAHHLSTWAHHLTHGHTTSAHGHITSQHGHVPKGQLQWAGQQLVINYAHPIPRPTSRGQPSEVQNAVQVRIHAGHRIGRECTGTGQFAVPVRRHRARAEGISKVTPPGTAVGHGTGVTHGVGVACAITHGDIRHAGSLTGSTTQVAMSHPGEGAVRWVEHVATVLVQTAAPYVRAQWPAWGGGGGVWKVRRCSRERMQGHVAKSSDHHVGLSPSRPWSLPPSPRGGRHGIKDGGGRRGAAQPRLLTPLCEERVLLLQLTIHLCEPLNVLRLLPVHPLLLLQLPLQQLGVLLCLLQFLQSLL